MFFQFAFCFSCFWTVGLAPIKVNFFILKVGATCLRLGPQINVCASEVLWECLAGILTELSVSFGLQTPQDPPGGSGKHCWEKWWLELGTGCSLTSISETEKKETGENDIQKHRIQTHPDEEAEKKSLNPPNGVGMRFESLILHADGFFFPFLCNWPTWHA